MNITGIRVQTAEVLHEKENGMESIDKGVAWSAVMVNTIRLNSNNPEHWKSIELQPTLNTPLVDIPEMEYFVNETSKKIFHMEGAPHRLGIFAILRYRNINDYLRSLDPRITPQVVILGSGFDTRPVTYKGKGLKFYEIDAEEVLNIKEAVYAQNNKDKNAIYITLDYIKEDLFAALEQNGLKFDVGTHFIWEGNSMFISAEANSQFWQKILKKFTGQVSISMDVCSKEMVAQTTGLEQNTNAVEIFKRMGAHMITGYNNIKEEFADPLGLSVLEDSSGRVLAQRYGVSTLRELPELEHHHVVHLLREKT